MRADLTSCSAQGVDAWLLGLLLGLALAFVPFLFSMRRGRIGLGCAFTALLLAATPAIWLLEPIAGLVPVHWLDCGTASRTLVLAGLTPLTMLGIGLVLALLVQASASYGEPQKRKSPPTEGGLST